MTITNGYCTLEDVKTNGRLNIESSDSGYDDLLEAIIEAVSRKIDDTCHRFFYTTSQQSRWYTAFNSEYVFIDDIPSDSDLTIELDTDDDGTINETMTTSDYILEPYNAPLDGWPYQKITRRQRGQFLFPKWCEKAVKVTSPFGWSSVPKPIVEACKLQSERVYMRAQTPIGSTSMSMLGKQYLQIPELDPDVCIMIEPYIKIRGMFG